MTEISKIDTRLKNGNPPVGEWDDNWDEATKEKWEKQRKNKLESDLKKHAEETLLSALDDIKEFILEGNCENNSLNAYDIAEKIADDKTSKFSGNKIMKKRTWNTAFANAWACPNGEAYKKVISGQFYYEGYFEKLGEILYTQAKILKELTILLRIEQ